MRGVIFLFELHAACVCDKGNKRQNNEDNYIFNGQMLSIDNDGMTSPIRMITRLDKDIFVAVFDGMGGENFGEVAAFSAAESLKNQLQRPFPRFFRRRYLVDLCLKMNEAVLNKAEELLTERMGSTVVLLIFTKRMVYGCNLGDSRSYRLQKNAIVQLSVDHTEKIPGKEKTPLLQHLGIDTAICMIEPHIVRCRLHKNDRFLLCSDGLTDMLTESEIESILKNERTAEKCVSNMLAAALSAGGKDNITVIVCDIL